jgi:sec-independent protein translocase protein TatA
MMPLAFGIPGGYEVLIIGFVALLIFGNRLPSVMKSLGKSVTEFKKGVAGIEDDLDAAATADKKPTVPTATTSTTTAQAPTTHE